MQCHNELIRASTASQNPTDSGPGHKKARCDGHIGPGDGGNDNMAQQLGTA